MLREQQSTGPYSQPYQQSQMPQQQHSRLRQRSSGSSTSSTPFWERVTPTSNIEDSVILSDLVRTGEASRLRRRGAMRLDRTSQSTSHHHHPSFDSELGDSDEESGPYGYSSQRGHRRYSSNHLHQHPYPSPSRWVSHLGEEQESDEDESSYILVCGAVVAHSSESNFNDSEPFQPSVLPVEPAKHSSTGHCSSSGAATNGCGAVVHLNASLSPSSRGAGKTYVARSAATESVVPLPAEYFQGWPSVKFETSSCGCVKEGVGCSFCGNPLGTRWTFCKTMAEGRRKAPWRERNRRQIPLRPEGPRYWQGTSSRATSRTRDESCPTSSQTQDAEDDQMELYTFFSNTVTAYRDEFETTLPKTPIPMVPTEPNSPLSSPTFAPASTLFHQPTWRVHDSGQGHESDAEDQSEEANIYLFRDSAPQGLAINVEVTVASSVSYPDRRRTYSDSTTTVVDAQRPPLFPVHSAPAVYGYQMTASPEQIELPLPGDDDGEGVAAMLGSQGMASPSAATSSAESFTLQQPVTIVDLASSPIRFSTELSDDGYGDSGQPFMSFYHEQILGASQREQRGIEDQLSMRSSMLDADEAIVDVDPDDACDEEERNVRGGFFFDR